MNDEKNAETIVENIEELPVSEQIASALEARAVFYETLSSLYFQPLKQADIDNMAAADFSVYADLNEDFADGVNDITRYLRKRNTGTRDELAVDFTGAFAGVKAYGTKTAVPYKSVFTSREGLLYQEGYVEVFRAYKAECVKRRPGLDWPDDHLSFMCEFMALLSRRTAAALAEGNKEQALHELQVSKQFLNDNILSWFGNFTDIANHLLTTRFYRGVIKITRGFFTLDLETLDDLIAEISASD
ncbi:MAG: molecular chaperone TorD family protein [Coriobacteriales bacterium]|nr:molecular chaperone TorD family protein [Coriobacteriales bacterium]